MTATVTVATQPTNAPPRNQLTLAGFTGASTATIVRTDGAGNQNFVRTGNPAQIVSGAAVLFDYEAPFNTAVTYTATPDTGSAATSAAATLVVVSQPWLIHPGFPALSQELIVTAMPDESSDVNQGVHTVLGRAAPVVITDGVRHATTFDITVRTETWTDFDALDGLLADGSVLLLQGTDPITGRTLYRWVSVGAVTKTPLVPVFANQLYHWTLSCTSTDAPSGLLQAEFEWNDIVADYATWADVKTAFPTWQDVVINHPTNN